LLTDSVTDVILTVVPDGTPLAVTVIVPPFEKLEPGLRLCVPSVDRLTVKVCARAVAHGESIADTNRTESQRPEVFFNVISSTALR